MRLRRLSVLVGVLLLASAVVGAAQRGRGGEGAHGTPVNPPGTDSGIRAGVRIVFSSGDAALIREHYRARYRSLPPGLQKKVARGGELPPGWQKKLEAFPADLERRLSPLPAGYHRGVFDGHAVITLPGGVVLDTVVLF